VNDYIAGTSVAAARRQEASMITTTEISRYDWATFFNSLTYLHIDEPVSIEVLRPDIGAQLQVDDLPLDGITAELKGRRASITIAAGTDPECHVWHVVSDPVSVRIARDSAGADEALEIVDADRTVTLIFFECDKDGSRG
jgi:hypothetical protein